MRQRRHWLEWGLGVGLGVLSFLLVLGFNVLPIVAAGLLAFLLSQSPGVRAVRSRAPATAPAVRHTLSFSDIGGQEPAKRELIEALDFVVQRSRAREMGIRPLRGILLTGPPGTGKTLLARAAAGYTRSAFLSVSGSEFVEMYAGVGAQRVRDLFRRARDAARATGANGSVIFIDEVEVLGGRRGAHTSHLEYDQTLNQLLVEMDGISGHEEPPILVIAASNRPDMLDPALLRPGRFDRVVVVDLPDCAGRLDILQLHSRGRPLAPEVDLAQVAGEAAGFSGAHLENLCNEAAILAFRAGSTVIRNEHLQEALDKVLLGEKQSRRLRGEEQQRVAVHEAGHALVGEWVQPGSVATATVVPRGRATGYVRSHPGEDRYLYTRAALEGQIRICLAGAIAEELCIGSRSTGAQADFDQAVDMARQIIRCGLSELGIVDGAAPDLAREGETVRAILIDQEEAVRQFLTVNQETLQQVAAALQARESLSGAEVRQLIPAPATAAVA